MKIIPLANQSRKNRVFFDNLVKELAICLNTGAESVNRDLQLPVYICHSHAGQLANGDEYFQITRDSGMTFKPIGEVLGKTTLDAIDHMLREAPPLIRHSNNRTLITNHLSAFTDLTDCHFTALNEMSSIH